MMDSRSWRVSALLSGCNVTYLSGRSRPRMANLAERCAEQQHRRATLLPVMSQVAQQVEGGLICPVQVIEQQHKWPPLRQSFHQALYRLKQTNLEGESISRRSREIGVAHAQFGQNA